VPTWPILLLTTCLTGPYNRYMMTKRTARPKYKSVAEFAEARNLRDWQLAELLGCDRSQATKLRRGKKYRSLSEPLHVARTCGIPIEALAPVESA
jgi:transcriptional regulator with XRE-family HTH domain